MTQTSRLLLVGGSSEIGLAIVDALLPTPSSVVLSGRPSPRLEAAVRRLRTAGHDVSTVVYDGTWGTDVTEGMLEDAWQTWGGFETVVVSVGVMALREADDVCLPSPASGVRSPHLEEMLKVNLIGPALVLDGCAARLAAQGHGSIVVVSSAAAVRPRREILAYAAAKQALDTLARGLDHRMRAHGGRCLVIRPGRVSTRMSSGLPKAPFTQNPAQVGRRVRQALVTDAHVAWSPRFMAVLTTGLKCTPRPVLPRSLR